MKWWWGGDRRTSSPLEAGSATDSISTESDGDDSDGSTEETGGTWENGDSGEESVTGLVAGDCRGLRSQRRKGWGFGGGRGIVGGWWGRKAEERAGQLEREVAKAKQRRLSSSSDGRSSLDWRSPYSPGNSQGCALPDSGMVEAGEKLRGGNRGEADDAVEESPSSDGETGSSGRRSTPSKMKGKGGGNLVPQESGESGSRPESIRRRGREDEDEEDDGAKGHGEKGGESLGQTRKRLLSVAKERGAQESEGVRGGLSNPRPQPDSREASPSSSPRNARPLGRRVESVPREREETSTPASLVTSRKARTAREGEDSEGGHEDSDREEVGAGSEEEEVARRRGSGAKGDAAKRRGEGMSNGARDDQKGTGGDSEGESVTRSSGPSKGDDVAGGGEKRGSKKRDSSQVAELSDSGGEMMTGRGRKRACRVEGAVVDLESVEVAVGAGGSGGGRVSLRGGREGRKDRGLHLDPVEGSSYTSGHGENALLATGGWASQVEMEARVGRSAVEHTSLWISNRYVDLKHSAGLPTSAPRCYR